VQRYEVERNARELMEDACFELTREVEGQIGAELLYWGGLRMREEMEHHTLMGEVWQEERGSMKLVLQAEIGRERESDDDRCRTRSVRLD
jgi:hypothetical protein